MNISATLDGESVNIINVNNDGHVIYITFVDSSSNIKVTKKFLDVSDGSITIATGATIN